MTDFGQQACGRKDKRREQPGKLWIRVSTGQKKGDARRVAAMMQLRMIERGKLAELATVILPMENGQDGIGEWPEAASLMKGQVVLQTRDGCLALALQDGRFSRERAKESESVG
jgi:hypothetical protein